MSVAAILRRVLFLFAPLSIVSTVYLYLYSIFHGCAFPPPPLRSGNATTGAAPFRLLALGDPQLEGDSSFPKPTDSLFPALDQLLEHASTSPEYLREAPGHALSFLTRDLPTSLKYLRKRVDLVGNDYYLAHIYRTVRWWTEPTHVAVLGDLLGSQWINDEEFERRGKRFWRRVFRGGERADDDDATTTTIQQGPAVLGQDPRWGRRIINVAGNHDVGYAGDMTAARVDRFERVFGKANWAMRFQMPRDAAQDELHDAAEAPELRIVVLNSLNLDSPTIDPHLQTKTYDFMNDVIMSSAPVEHQHVATVLLTHLPLHKDQGVCVDGPHISYNDVAHDSGIKEQNHVSYTAGLSILQGIFGMSSDPSVPGNGLGRPGIILTGHDHEGCDVYHHISQSPDKGQDSSEPQSWKATRWPDVTNLTRPGIREVTVRSMMGEFGGNAGLLSAWYDDAAQQWRFEYASCSLGVQHIWWAVHVADLLALGMALFVLLDACWGFDTGGKGATAKTLGESRRAVSVQGRTESTLATGSEPGRVSGRKRLARR